MFRERQRRKSRTRLAVDITALLDVTFNLIIFLVVTTNFHKEEHAFIIELPTASNENVQVATDKTTVYVTRSGELYLLRVAADEPATGPVAVDTNQKLTREALMRELKALYDKDKELPIAVRGEKDASYQTLMDVVSAIQEVGFKSVWFPYELEQPAP
jgi:biopolymer transport protein ExbD